MKYVVSILFISMFYTNISYAAITDNQEKDDQVCYVIADLAKSIMQARQVNVPITSIYKMAGDSKGVKMLVRAAYMIPLWNTEENKNKAVTEFSNKVFSECIST